MTSTVVYNGDLRTTNTHEKSGTVIYTDAPTDNQGKGESFSPTDLVATALANCMITIMGIKANSLEIDMTNTRAEVTKIMESNPRRISEIHVKLFFPENNWSEDVQQSLIRSALQCPVAKSIHPDIEQNVEFFFS